MPFTFKTGNAHNFNINNVTLRQGETRDTIDKLNRIELRYNTRKEDPHYPQFKSLYKWRSIFGYHLGGVIRQGIVKLAEVKRHFENAINLHEAAKGMRKEMKGSFGEITLDDYVRLYSTRDIISAMKKDGVPTDTIKYMKYLTYDSFKESLHAKVADYDYSVRKLVVDVINEGRVKRHQKATSEREEMSNRNIDAFLGEREIVETPETKEMQEKVDRVNESEKGMGNVKRFVRGAFGLKKLENALATVKVKFNLSARWENAKFELQAFRDERKEEIKELKRLIGTEKEIASLERRTGFTEFVKGFFETREVKNSKSVTHEEIKERHEKQRQEALQKLDLDAPLKDGKEPNISLREQLGNVRFGKNGEKNAL